MTYEQFSNATLMIAILVQNGKDHATALSITIDLMQLRFDDSIPHIK